MGRSMKRFLRMGLVHFMAYPGVVSGQDSWTRTLAEVAADPFFDAVEISHIPDPAERARVRDMLRLAGLGVGYGGGPIILGQKLDLNATDETRRRAAVAEINRHTAEAVEMGAGVFQILSGPDPGDALRPRAVEALVASLKEVCAHAASLGGPVMALEVFDRAVDKRCLVGPTDLAVQVAAEVRRDCPNFGLLVDLSHVPLLGESIRESLVPVAPYLVAAHLGNAVVDQAKPGYGDNHPAFGADGGANGVDQVAEFLGTLLEIGFLDPGRRPVVSFEVKPMPGQDTRLVVANAKRVMELAWDMVAPRLPS